jgi:anthranilate phosphoribosyltransferase
VNFAHFIKEIGRGAQGARDLSEDDAYRLFAAMLDGGVPELELGAIVLSLRNKTESVNELLGFQRAVNERLVHWRPPASDARTVVIPTYNGARHQANLLPLLVLLLKRIGVPVLVHGCLDGNGRVASAYILRELGILPCLTAGQAQRALEAEGLAFVPTAVLAPGMASLLALRGRLGVRNSAHTLVKLMDPFDGEGLRLCSVSHPAYLEKLAGYLLQSGGRALLMRGTEGEPFANPKRRPQIVHYEHGSAQVLFEAELGPIRSLPGLPDSIEPVPTAAWIRRVMAGELPLPHPLANQLACCLFASGYTQDMNQAKAIAAVEAGSLIA